MAVKNNNTLLKTTQLWSKPVAGAANFKISLNYSTKIINLIIQIIQVYALY